MKYYRSHVLVCADPECLSKGAHEVMDSLQDELVSQGLIDEVQVLETSRLGGCSDGPEMMVYPEGIHYTGLTPDDMPYLVEEHFLKGRVAQKFLSVAPSISDEELSAPKPKEVRIVLRNCGKIDPENIEDYIAEDGYMALGQVLSSMAPEQVIEVVSKSGLRGRGGAGFPTG
jgi:(2Fe-2S) ferredoxin